ncbi:MAG: hypothetical protein E7288_03685 [Lachnospiraceae bacterium]|nr:hypothetical protein [Lachnospiraceae bacterium]
MNYLYMTCKNCGREAIKEQIFKNYGVQIDSDSLYKDDFAKKVKAIFEKELKEAKKKCKPASVIKEAYDRLRSDEKSTEPGQVHLETAIKEVETIISDYVNFSDDLSADVLMGLLWADENYNIDFDKYVDIAVGERTRKEKLRWVWSQNDKGAGGSRENYPYADIVDYIKEPVPGGCVEYHQLMMTSDYVTIYDVPDNLAKNQNMYMYTYQKADDIYQKLIDAPIENILLLERSLGIQTTNLWYICNKNVEDMTALKKIDEIIWQCNRIEPIFLRYRIIPIVSRYFSVAENGVLNAYEIAKELAHAVADFIIPIYEKVFKYVWSIYYLAYEVADEKEKHRLLNNLRMNVSGCWDAYYKATDAELYSVFVKEYEQYDWRAEKTVEAYFEKMDICIETKGTDYEVDNQKISWNTTVFDKTEMVNIICADGSLISFLAEKPLPGLGEKIRQVAIKECSYEWVSIAENMDLDERNKYYRMLLHKKEKDLFGVMIKQKKKKFKDKGCRYNEKKGTPNNVYAYIHWQVIKNHLF